MAFISSQTNFSGGEISRRLHGRVDIPQYANSVDTLENFTLHPHGGASTRPGFRLVTETKHADKYSILIPFQHSVDQAYAIEAGDNYFRFCMDGGIIVLATDAAAYDSGTTYIIGDLALYSGVNYRSKVDANLANQPDISPDEWLELIDDIYEIDTPYTEDAIPLIKYCQSADVMYLVHPDFPPAKLSRTDHTAWILEDVEFTCDEPAAYNAGETYEIDDRVLYSAVWYKSLVDANIGNQPDTNPAEWEEITVYYPEGWDTGNFPSCVMFFEQRLLFSGVPSDPQRIWSSRTGSYHDMSVGATVEADDPIDFTIAADQVNVVRWMMPSDQLAIGTVGGAWMMGGTPLEPLSPSSVQVKRHTTTGTANIQPVHVSNVILYASRTGRSIHELAYVFTEDKYLAPDLMLLAEHLTREHPIVEIAYQQEPNSILWCLRSDGVLLSLTYMRDKGIVGWAQHSTEGQFESICSIQGYSENDVYVTVNRTVNGSTVRFIEALDPEFAGLDLDDAFCVDCGLSYDGVATASFAGLDHLEGEEVAVLADGKVHPAVTVSGGAITLNYTAEKVHAGLPFESNIKTLKLETMIKTGSTQGRFKRIAEVVLMLTDTMGGSVGADDDSIYPLLFNEEQSYGNANTLFSGSKIASVDGGWDREASITVKQDQPLPLTINAITLTYEVS